MPLLPTTMSKPTEYVEAWSRVKSFPLNSLPHQDGEMTELKYHKLIKPIAVAILTDPVLRALLELLAAAGYVAVDCK